MRPVYLDYNATTPTDPRVVDAMLPYLTTSIGNAASVDHFFGHEAQGAVERARVQVADLIGARADEVVFTSGATEANNLAVLGTLERAGDDAEVIVSAIEHPAVLEPARRFGARVRVVPVSSDGVVDPSEVRRRLTPKTALVSVMTANNETGAIQPIADIGKLCRESEVAFHTDAVQAMARLAVDVDEASIDLLSLSAHKMYGSMGVGALFIRKRGRRIKVAPLHFGGGQERSIRPGTANVPGIVGLGLAADLAVSERGADAAREAGLKRRLAASLAACAGIESNIGGGGLCQTLSVRIDGVNARALMRRTQDGLAFSSGSACATTKVEPSHVLLAQGLSASQASESIRLSFGRFTTDGEIDQAADVLVTAVRELRSISASR